MRSIDLHVDVTEAAGLGEPAHIALTVTVPDAVPDRSRRLLRQTGRRLRARLLHRGPPWAGPRARQAAWHAARGWIFVSVDHLGVGDSSLHDPERLTFAPVVGGQ